MKIFYSLILSLLFLASANAENVVNGGFETWGGVPLNPTGWTTSNFGSNINVTQDTPLSGAHAAKGAVTTAGSTAYLTSVLDTVSHAYVYLTFWYKCNLVSGDVFNISTIVYKADGSSAVGSATLNITANSTSWQSKSVTIGYFSSPAARASASFTMSNTSSVHVGSYFVVDNVAFSDTYIGIDEIEESTRLQIFPNPVHDVLTIKTNASLPMQLTLSDALGKIVEQRMSVNPVNGYITDAINTESLSSGLYFLMLTSDKKTILRRVIVE
jgi:hypothetical protein